MPSSSLIAVPTDVIYADQVKHTRSVPCDVTHVEVALIPESIRSDDENFEKGQKALRLCSVIIKIVGLLVIIGIVVLFAHFVPKFVQQANNTNTYNANPIKANLPDMKGVNDN